MKEYDPSNSSLENYVAASHTIARTVELISGKKVTEGVIDSWKVLGATMRFADDALDNTNDPKERSRIAKEALGYLRDHDKEEFSINNDGLQSFLPSLKTRVSALTPDRQDYFFRNLANLLKVADQIHGATNIRRLSFLTRLEGQLTSRLYLAFLPQELNTSSVVQGVTRFSRLANSVDTAADLYKDFNNGEVIVDPSARNRTFLLIDTFRDGLSALRTIKPTVGFIGEALYKTHVTILGRTRR